VLYIGPMQRTQSMQRPWPHPEPSGDVDADAPWIAPWATHALGLVWVLGAAAAVMAPALAHGASLGPFDLLTRYGLTRQHGVVVHDALSSDQIDAFIPWTTLAWTQVHHGVLPLWNPYNALGLPLAFNWQSAVFSLPSAIGYLFPLHLAYTVSVLVTLVIAGTGVYVLGRVLGLGALGCTMAATVYELSGPFMGWLGWPVAGVMSWAGWLFAATILVVRGRHRLRAVAFFAVVLALVLYAGQPEIVVLLACALLVYLVVLLGLRAPWLGGSGPIRRPVFDVAAGTVAGVALGAPIVLPGSQVAGASIRRSVGFLGSLPPHDLVHVLFQGFDGLPVAGSRSFGGLNYIESAAYVGVIVVVLGVLAVAVRWRQPQPLAFGALALSAAGLAFVSPASSLLFFVPAIGRVQWHRDLVSMAFGLAVLAGMGTELLVRSWRARTVQKWGTGGFAVAAVVIGAVWLVGRGSLPPVQSAIRARSFIWPTIATAVGLAAMGLVIRAARRARAPDGAHTRRSTPASADVGTVAAIALLVCETAFLVAAGAPLWSSQPTYPQPTAAVRAVQRTTGASLVGLGVATCYPFPDIGIIANANILYQMHELAAYDPAVPSEYFSSWRAATGRPAGFPTFKELCPAVTSATLARRYGVSYVLDPPGTRGPSGARLVKRVGNEDLYRIPGAAPATVLSLGPDGALPSDDAAGRAVTVSHPDPATWSMRTDAARPAVLRLRLTDVPGWHASIDGRPLALERFAGMMLEARIPPGSHHVELHYWPDTFDVGLVLAAVAVLALAGAGVLTRYRATHRPSTHRRSGGW
jgi:hypothetical protein